MINGILSHYTLYYSVGDVVDSLNLTHSGNMVSALVVALHSLLYLHFVTWLRSNHTLLLGFNHIKKYLQTFQLQLEVEKVHQLLQ